MATLGRPAINNPRSLELREIVAIVAAIRERFAALEKLVAASGAATASSSTVSPSGTSAAAAFLRSLDSVANGLLVKVAANSMQSRSFEAAAELEVENADGVSGNPRLTWVAQAASQVFAAPLGYNGTPSFRVLELASPDFLGQGSLGTVLHGNEYGEPFWSPIDLALEVQGVLPAEHLDGLYDIDIAGAAAKLSPVAAPLSSLADGEEGQVAWDATYFYVCLGPYTWRRVALATF